MQITITKEDIIKTLGIGIAYPNTPEGMVQALQDYMPAEFTALEPKQVEQPGTKYYDPSLNDHPECVERRVSPLTRFKFDLLEEKASLEVQYEINQDKSIKEWDYVIARDTAKRISIIDNAVMLLNEALEQGKK